MNKQQLLKVISVALRIIVAIVFLLAGSGKFQLDSTIATSFKNWGLGIPMMFMVGIAEIAGAIALLLPKTVKYGCFLLAAIMLGAAVVHLLNFKELGFPLLNLIIIILLTFILYTNNSRSRILTN